MDAQSVAAAPEWNYRPVNRHEVFADHHRDRAVVSRSIQRTGATNVGTEDIMPGIVDDAQDAGKFFKGATIILFILSF
jgi:hypothetical protein